MPKELVNAITSKLKYRNTSVDVGKRNGRHEQSKMYENRTQSYICLHFSQQYAQIVLRFDDQLSTWKVEKSADDYRRAFADLDSKRTMIHNNCLHDIKILNRMAESAQPALTPFAVITPEMNRTNIGNGILKQYYKDLLLNEKKVLG